MPGLWPGAYAAYFLVLLLSWPAWKRCTRRFEQRWRRAKEEESLDRALLGVDDDGAGSFLPETDRPKHVFIAGASGYGKTQGQVRVAEMVTGSDGLLLANPIPTSKPHRLASSKAMNRPSTRAYRFSCLAFCSGE
jgi:hypothetical protein